MAEREDTKLFEMSELQTSLLSLNLKQDQVEFIIKQGEKYLNKHDILSLKLSISKDLAKKVLEVLKSTEQTSKLILTSDDVQRIETCPEAHSDVYKYEDIALLSDVDEELVSSFFEKHSLTMKQRTLIQENYDIGQSVHTISKVLNIKKEKVNEYIEAMFVTFSGEEGKSVFDIIIKHYGEISLSNLRQQIRFKNLKLQDQLYCVLRFRNESEYKKVNDYFLKHEESKDFLEVDTNLTMDDIFILKKGNKDNVEQLSLKLNKVESVINAFFKHYSVQPVEEKYYQELQWKKTANVSKSFEARTFTLNEYSTILTYSFDHLINQIDLEKNTTKPQDMFIELLPLIFYYIRCSLHFEDIHRLLSNVSEIPLTTHDIFHIIFQLSEPVLRGLCIEHYSFSNPVPLYYPKLKPSESESSGKVEFEICKELWYCLEQYNGLISFGLGRASWNGVGKSSLLDLIFETDFVKGSPQSSVFHLGSIDIQLTRNLFGETNESNPESTKWAYIDCHSYSDLRVIQVMCSHLDVALVHVCYSDYVHNRDELDRELSLFSVRYIYILLRDCDCKEVTVEHTHINGVSFVRVSIPNLTNLSKSISIAKSLKDIGYEIIHSSNGILKPVHSQFIYEILQELDSTVFEYLVVDKIRILNITQLLNESIKTGVSCLSYYPCFVEYMGLYMKTCLETGQEKVDTCISSDCKQLEEKLEKISMSDIILHLNLILQQRNSTLILLKLSKEILSISEYYRINKVTSPNQKVELMNIQYSLRILWRESLLYFKYSPTIENSLYLSCKEQFASNYSKHVASGGAFELIDGDNLRFFSKEIDLLLNHYYIKQKYFFEQINKGKTIKIKEAPIVVSIIGPQGSGKSTLLNYCFGCKFLTSAGRCTRGIYGSLSNLDRPVNLSQSFLILDTEGLDAIERENNKDTSMIHFDRQVVLFCLAVSQVVIINVKGDIGSEMQNLLQICAYSLNRLKVSKVKAPKIFFILNQQADPDPNKHLDTINFLMEKLSAESSLLETDEVKISDLIQVSKENLFILPSAFNSDKMNKPIARLFDSDIVKLSPTISFADMCTNLRLAIMNLLDEMPIDYRAPFQTMSEWVEMAGVIWDTVIKYQDIVKYKIVDELKYSNQLEKIVTNLMQKYFYDNHVKFTNLTKGICLETKFIKFYVKLDVILAEKMMKFDEIFATFQQCCFKEFSSICSNDNLLRKMELICNENRSNLKRLIYVVRKQYEDQIKLQIKSILIEIELSDNMKNFQSILKENMEKYCKSNNFELKNIFEVIWKESFGIDDLEEEQRELEESFSHLYSIFKMEYHSMENKKDVFKLFHNYNFRMHDILASIEADILERIHDQNQDIDQTEQFINTLYSTHAPIKDMVPYNGRLRYSYLSQKSLYERYTTTNRLSPSVKITPFLWIPKECEGLLQYCSGYYNHPDIIWKTNKTKQVNILKSYLLDPNDLKTNTWTKFLKDISQDVLKLLVSDSDLEVSPAVVKKIIHAFCFRIRLLNHEIGFIHAGLSNKAERTLSTFVFALAFKFLWQSKIQIRQKNKAKKDIKKQELFDFFEQKLEDHKMLQGKWNQDWMATSDRHISRKYASDLVESVKRGLKTSQQQNLMDLLEYICPKESLSFEGMLELAYGRMILEVYKPSLKEVTDTDSFVVRYVCNRNAVIQELFRQKWGEVESKLYIKISQRMKDEFMLKISNLKSILADLLEDLGKQWQGKNPKAFESDIFSGIAEKTGINFTEAKEVPFKAMNKYLRKYFDPTVSVEDLNKFLTVGFEVDEIKVKVSEASILPHKRLEPVLDEDIFDKLVNTEMFSDTELIFNLYTYVESFSSLLNEYCFNLENEEFQEMILSLKSDFEKNVEGCPSQCPSCGKYCEKQIHPNGGKCQIKTGHQISSMGGYVWNADKFKTAIMFMCDDYMDKTPINLPNRILEWGEFKYKFGKGWNWNSCEDEKYKLKQKSNPELMKNVWNKFGRAILEYHNKAHGTHISFIPFTTYEEVREPLLPLQYSICFVIDGSMKKDIARVRISVGQLIASFITRASFSEFRLVIYRDHCDEKVVESFPNGKNFTTDQKAVVDFLKNVVATCGGDFPEAVLDGLATAATQSEWKLSPGVRNKIIHIFDSPPHGDFPDYRSHSSYSNINNCCCCNHGTLCHFDWDTDVWRNFKRFNIEYHAITTSYELKLNTYQDVSMNKVKYSGCDLIYSKHELKMRQELGDLCLNFQDLGKEVVNDAIVKIFVDFKKENIY